MHQSTFHPTLYTPATTPLDKLLALANGERSGHGVWRLVICTEDSVAPDDVDFALINIAKMLSQIDAETPVCNFVRVRNHDVLTHVLDLDGIDKIDGFVVPKATPEGFVKYAQPLVGSGFKLMPIIETCETRDYRFREELRAAFCEPSYRPLIDCVRIGGNDLMGHLGIRRPTNNDHTIYTTPVGGTIFDVVNEFRGLAGFEVTAPVFECFAPRYDDLFRDEVKRHVLNELFGQTVIHPRHLRMLRDLYKVNVNDLQSARNIVESTKAVEGCQGRMDELTTHLVWAQRIIERFELFGDDEHSGTESGLLSL